MGYKGLSNGLNIAQDSLVLIFNLAFLPNHRVQVIDCREPYIGAVFFLSASFGAQTKNAVCELMRILTLM